MTPLNPHFYKLRSRLGMINLPWKQSELNIGVEEGADAILSGEFTAQFPNAVVDSFDFPLPESIDSKQSLDAIASSSQQALAFIEETFDENGEMQVVIGGDHSVSFSSLLAVVRRKHIKNTGYIRIDSHPDVLSPLTSTTGNFHGMWMRPFIDEFPQKQIADLVGEDKFKNSQMIFIGHMDYDGEEKVIFKERNIRVIEPKELRIHKNNAVKELQSFMKSFDHIHLDIDIDGFDSSIAPATGLPATGGLLKNDVDFLFELFSKQPSRSLDLVEVNPQKEGAEETINLAQSILKTVLK